MQKRTVLLFWRLAMQYPFRTIFTMMGSASTAIIGAFLGPLVIAQVLNHIQADTVSLESMWSLIVLYAITQIYGEIIGWRINTYLAWTMETAAQKDLYQKIFSSLSQQSLSFHADRFGGALVAQTTKLVNAFERFWDTIFFQVMPTLASIVGATIILSFVFWQYAVFLLLISIIFMIYAYFGSRHLAKLNVEDAQAHSDVTAFVADAITNILTIKSYSKENAELKTMREKAATWRGKSLASMRGFLYVSTGYSSLIAILNIAAVVGAVIASEKHLISISVVYLCVSYTLTVARQLWEINNIMRNYNRIFGDAYDMVDILNTKSVVQDKTNHKLKVERANIDMDRVGFSHNPNQALFDNFSLSIPSGQRIGLVGHSGSGKTTLTKLLLRFADVQEGSISIDGQDISKITQQSLRDAIAYVPQEPLLFHRTLRENIAYSRPSASDDEVREAAKKAHALEFIEKLPDGFDTLVGERGVKLSGGQRQRIAIARAILKDAPILILDEATSALDSESEKLIQEALKKLMKGRTSIVIAHRLSTISHLDRIVVLDNGKVIEDGTHTELLKNNGAYAKLWSHQSGGFLED